MALPKGRCRKRVKRNHLPLGTGWGLSGRRDPLESFGARFRIPTQACDVLDSVIKCQWLLMAGVSDDPGGNEI